MIILSVMQQSCHPPAWTLVPGAEFVMTKGSAYLTMQDNPEEYNRVIREFLASLEENAGA